MRRVLAGHHAVRDHLWEAAAAERRGVAQPEVGEGRHADGAAGGAFQDAPRDDARKLAYFVFYLAGTFEVLSSLLAVLLVGGGCFVWERWRAFGFGVVWFWCGLVLVLVWFGFGVVWFGFGFGVVCVRCWCTVLMFLSASCCLRVVALVFLPMVCVCVFS